MHFFKLFGAQGKPRISAAVSQYAVGQRTVELVQLDDGRAHWVCSCDNYVAAADAVGGGWCKHVAKACAIRSIERLTGARVISRPEIQ